MLSLYINQTSSSVCMYVCMYVCMFVCPQTTPREINEYGQIIHHWKRNFPGTEVIFFTTGYDYLVRKYSQITDFEQPLDSSIY